MVVSESLTYRRNKNNIIVDHSWASHGCFVISLLPQYDNIFAFIPIDDYGMIDGSVHCIAWNFHNNVMCSKNYSII